MNKIYSLNDCSHRKLLNLKKLFPLGLFLRSLIFLFILFSLNLFSQESKISGIENIHLSEGATIIEQKDNKITIVASVSSKKIDDKKSEKDIHNYSEEKRITTISKKSVKKITNKLINKVKNSSSNLHIYNKNTSSEESFVTLNYFSKQGVNSSNNYNHNYVKIGNDFIFIIYYHKAKIKVLSCNYSSQITRNNLFTRPPPYFS